MQNAIGKLSCCDAVLRNYWLIKMQLAYVELA